MTRRVLLGISLAALVVAAPGCAVAYDRWDAPTGHPSDPDAPAAPPPAVPDRFADADPAATEPRRAEGGAPAKDPHEGHRR